jgi:hypothetical protein
LDKTRGEHESCERGKNSGYDARDNQRRESEVGLSYKDDQCERGCRGDEIDQGGKIQADTCLKDHRRNARKHEEEEADRRDAKCGLDAV